MVRTPTKLSEPLRSESRQDLTAIPLVPEPPREIGLVLLRRDPQPAPIAAAMSSLHTRDLQTRMDTQPVQ